MNMRKGIELEYKMLLKSNQFRRIQQKYPFNYPIKQVNHYYDTSDKILNKKRYALRIRDVGNKRILTLKVPQKQGVMEYECEVDSYDFTVLELPSELLEVLSFLDVKDLKKFASLTTYRSIYETDDAIICLDENHYAKRHDYEIEYEVKRKHDSLSAFLTLLRENSIYEFKPAPGKARRIKNAIRFDKTPKR